MGMNCPSLQPLAYEIFSKNLHNKVVQQRIPVNGSFEVTMRCNLRCQHCYIPFSQRAGSRQNELTFPEIQRIFSEIADAGCLWLLLTGGEPFLRPDFLDIYDDAKHKGFIISLFTNGTLLNEAIVDHLAEFKPLSIEISLYGATQATYERVTGIPGSFARCMRGIDLILARELPLKLKSVLITLNQDELQIMKQFTENLGLEFYYDPVINAGLDGSLHPTQFRLTPDQIINTQTQDPRILEEWAKTLQFSKGFKEQSNLLYFCNAGRLGFHIDAFGKLSICMVTRTPNFDLRSISFKEAWTDFIPKVISLEYYQPNPCDGCELRLFCSQCPAMSLNETGDPYKTIPFLCELAHKKQPILTQLANRS